MDGVSTVSEYIDLLKGIRALLYSDGFTIKGVQKVLKEKGLRHVAEIGRGGRPEQRALETRVIEKIAHVEKPAAAPARKPRPVHLRPVPPALSLPFFDLLEPTRMPRRTKAKPMVAEVVVARAEIEAGHGRGGAVPSGGGRLSRWSAAREWLKTLLDDLGSLKTRLRAARKRAEFRCRICLSKIVWFRDILGLLAGLSPLCSRRPSQTPGPALFFLGPFGP